MRSVILYIAMICVVITSCTKNDTSQPTNKRAELSLRTSSTTRVDGSLWESGDRIGLYMVEAGASDLSAPIDGAENLIYCATADALAYTSFTPLSAAAYYPESGSLVDLYAYYPHSEAEDHAITVTPNTDYLHAMAVGCSAADSGGVSLSFRHMMAMVEMSISSTVWDLAAIKVTFEGFAAEATMCLYLGGVSEQRGEATVDAVTAPDGSQSSVILIPMTSQRDAAKALFTLSDGQCYEWDLSRAIFEAGKIYSYDISIGTESVAANLLYIEDWLVQDEGRLDAALKGESFEDSVDDPLLTSHLISSAEELQLLAERVNSGVNYSGVTFTLINDIDLSAVEFTAIGSSSTNSFQGTFDGDGYTIRSLSIEKSGATANLQGLFGCIYGATIKNLTVEGAVSGVGYVGGVVGYAQYSTILNCGSRVEVTGAAYVGGVVGYLVGGAIYNSYNTGQVRVTSSSYGGGFIGCVESSAAVVCCYSAGAVIGYSPATSGGFVGYNSGSSIAYSFWASDVSGTANVTAAYNGYGDVSTLYAYSYALMRVAGFVTILNDFNRSDEWTAWRADSQLVNEGYPIL